jgi:hypothetical protein
MIWLGVRQESLSINTEFTCLCTIQEWKSKDTTTFLFGLSFLRIFQSQNKVNLILTRFYSINLYFMSFFCMTEMRKSKLDHKQENGKQIQSNFSHNLGIHQSLFNFSSNYHFQCQSLLFWVKSGLQNTSEMQDEGLNKIGGHLMKF